MDEPTANPQSTRVEHRRGSRFPVVVPVEVKWQEPSGKTIQEAARAKEANAQGGLLDMQTYPGVGSQLELTNLLSGEATEARVVAVRRSREGAVLGVAVELLVPSETFWGVNFQLRKTGAELVKLEQAIKSGGVDARILREFRDAVDYKWNAQEEREQMRVLGNPSPADTNCLRLVSFRRTPPGENEPVVAPMTFEAVERA